MTPTPQEPTLRAGEVGAGLDGESIVISGMSGIYPMSNSVTEFSKILYDKINPVVLQSNRKNFNHPELSGYLGKVPNLDRFDSQFFKVHHILANSMDPMARKVLEHSYQAIYDAGINPKDLYGKKVGVFIGSSLAELELVFYEVSDNRVQTYKMTGSSKTMYANRISYWLNANGPSLTLDDACCASTLALEEACSAIKNGICESAIVGGTNLCIFPETQVHFNRCMHISPGAETKSFDQNADGCTKSEAIGIIFLQKAKDALRVYAEVVHVKNEFSSTIRGETGQAFGFLRNPDVSASFMKKFYKEADVSPQAVEYIEACGSANPEADKAELQSIEKVFCDNRTDPLLVGSVISNVGYTDSASGVTALTKVPTPLYHFPNPKNNHEMFKGRVTKVGDHIKVLDEDYNFKNRKVFRRHFDQVYIYSKKLCALAAPSLCLPVENVTNMTVEEPHVAASITLKAAQIAVHQAPFIPGECIKQANEKRLHTRIGIHLLDYR